MASGSRESGDWYNKTKTEWLAVPPEARPPVLLIGPGSGPRVQRHIATSLKDEGSYVKAGLGILARADLDTKLVAPVVARAAVRALAEREAGSKLILSLASAYARGPVGRMIAVAGASRKPVKTYDHFDVLKVIAFDFSPYCYEHLKLQDAWGEYSVLRESDAMVFLQCFRGATSVRAALLSDRDMQLLVQDFVKSVDGLDNAVSALSICAHHLRKCNAGGDFDLDRAVDKFRFYLEGDVIPAPKPIEPATRVRAGIYWFGRKVGELTHTGAWWRLDYNAWTLPLWSKQKPDSVSLPLGIESMMPEGANLRHGPVVDGEHTDRVIHRIETGCRYTSNVIITPDSGKLEVAPRDILLGQLHNHCNRGVFRKPVDDYDMIKTMPDRFADKAKSGYVPAVISGHQLKAPATLSVGGTLSPAIESPFTHILKLGTAAGSPALVMPTNEWFCMSILRDVGLNTSVVGLLPGTTMTGHSVIVERWDIPRNKDDRRLMMSEDFMSVLGKHAFDGLTKYDSSVEEVAAALAAVSTDASNDLLFLYEHVVSSWILGNGDLHLKNLSLLKVANVTLDGFESVRLSPIYDVVCTAAIPGYRHDRFALMINNKRSGHTLSDFVAFGTTSCQLSELQCLNVARSLATKILRRVGIRIQTLPPEISTMDYSRSAITEAATVIIDRAAAVLGLTVEQAIKGHGPEIEETYYRGLNLHRHGVMEDRVKAEQEAQHGNPLFDATSAITRALPPMPSATHDTPHPQPQPGSLRDRLDPKDGWALPSALPDLDIPSPPTPLSARPSV